MGLLYFAFGGVGFILIGIYESLHVTPSTPIPSPLNSIPPPKQDSQTNKNKNKNPSPLYFIALSIFSLLFTINSFVSLVDAHNSNDAVGSALQLQIIAIALIFLLYSILELLATFNNPLPSPLLNLICAFAFVEEFLLFYLQRKDPNGVENRYYDLLLVPILGCVFSTVLELKSPGSYAPKLARAVGMILHGTWFIQMGLSLFSSWVAEGCSLHQVSRGNYTMRCKGHPESHRAKAIATLQFNCHLALMVVVVVGMYSVICGRNGGFVDSSRYRPIGAEMVQIENSANFTLDSDEDDDVQKGVAVERMNGNGLNH